MFGRESKPCKVYEYGCLQPVAGEEVLIEEMHCRQQLWNKLVEIERAHREKVREILVVPDDPVTPLMERLKELREQIKLARKKERTGKVDVTPLQKQARELREQIATAKIQRNEAKKLARETNKDALDQLEKERREAVKAAAKVSGLYWVNAEEVRNNYEIARRRAMRDKTELRFHRWDGTGKVTVRWQKGLSVPGVFKNDTRMQIDPVPEEAWEHPTRSVRRKKSRTRIRLRVTSDEKKKPVWVELPMVMHRPIPEESEIRCASVIREKVGRKYRYKVVITATVTNNYPLHGNGTIGIDLGWRQVKDGLRVAYWADDRGEHGQLLLEPEILHEFNKLPDLRAIRDKHFNEIKSELSAWAANNNKPDWLTEELKTINAWRSPGRLVALIFRWSVQRFEGDVEIYEKLEYWRKRENHLYDWEANLRDQVHRRRREIYRIFAADVIKKYGTVVLEDFDLRKVARKKDAEEGTRGSLPMDRQRFIASVSELRLAIQNACARAGAAVYTVDAKYTTVECYECGHRENFDASAKLMRTCPKCKKLWDQDYNAAINLLHRGVEVRK